jgi:hypothetical protein
VAPHNVPSIDWKRIGIGDEKLIDGDSPNIPYRIQVKLSLWPSPRPSLPPPAQLLAFDLPIAHSSSFLYPGKFSSSNEVKFVPVASLISLLPVRLGVTSAMPKLTKRFLSGVSTGVVFVTVTANLASPEVIDSRSNTISADRLYDGLVVEARL